jgi:hypothetical protein
VKHAFEEIEIVAAVDGEVLHFHAELFAEVLEIFVIGIYELSAELAEHALVEIALVYMRPSQRLLASNTTGDAPAACRRLAAVSPGTPPPTMATVFGTDPLCRSGSLAQALQSGIGASAAAPAVAAESRNICRRLSAEDRGQTTPSSFDA